MLATDAEQDDESHQVLDIHHRKNKTIKPPTGSITADSSHISHVPANSTQDPVDRSNVPGDHSNYLCNCSRTPADRSHAPANSTQVPADRSQVPGNRSNAPANSTQVPRAANRSHVQNNDSNAPADRSQARRVPGNSTQVPVDHYNAPGNRSNAPADRSHRVPGNSTQVPNHSYNAPDDHSVPANRVPANFSQVSDPDEADDEDNGNDNGGRKQRATRNSKSHGEPKPNQLGYYSGPWNDVLVNARHQYRKFIHTNDPFPERNLSSLKDVQDILLEAIAAHKEEGGELDEGSSIIYPFPNFIKFTHNMIAVYNENHSGMTILVRWCDFAEYLLLADPLFSDLRRWGCVSGTYEINGP